MSSSSPEAQRSAPQTGVPHGGADAGHPPPAARATVTENGVTVAERGGTPIILYERLTGEEARRRAESPEPQGAGMAREAVEKVEYVEVWSTQDPADGYDFRMYSFGGALIASRSTRGH